MNVTINEETLELLKELLIKENKSAIRLKKSGFACGGINIEIVADEVKENDDVTEDKGITIVADKSISHFIRKAEINYTKGYYGPIFKLR